MTDEETVDRWTRLHLAIAKLDRDRPRDRNRRSLIGVLCARVEQHRCDICGQFAERVSRRPVLGLTLHDCGCPYSKAVRLRFLEDEGGT